MEFTDAQLKLFKEHEKTQWLAGQFESDLAKLEEAKTLASSDPEMAELAAEEIATLETSLTAQLAEMERIIDANAEEEKRPYGVVLEVRAGAGGDEASLCRRTRQHVPEVRRKAGLADYEAVRLSFGCRGI